MPGTMDWISLLQPGATVQLFRPPTPRRCVTPETLLAGRRIVVIKGVVERKLKSYNYVMCILLLRSTDARCIMARRRTGVFCMPHTL